MTATSDAEKQDVLGQLLASDPGDHLLHESFNPDNPQQFTRRSFGWPNALFSEFVITQFEGDPGDPDGRHERPRVPLGVAREGRHHPRLSMGR